MAFAQCPRFLSVSFKPSWAEGCLVPTTLGWMFHGKGAGSRSCVRSGGGGGALPYVPYVLNLIRYILHSQSSGPLSSDLALKGSLPPTPVGQWPGSGQHCRVSPWPLCNSWAGPGFMCFWLLLYPDISLPERGT